MEFTIFEGHRNCSKALKPFIDIFKVYKKLPTESIPIIDLVDKIVMNTYNNTVVITSLENVKNIFSPMEEKLTLDDIFNVFTFDREELELFILAIDAPKKEFIDVRWVYEEERKRFKLKVLIKSKLSGMVMDIDLPLRKISRNSSVDKHLIDLHQKYIIYAKDPWDGTHGRTKLSMTEDEKYDIIDDISCGEVVILKEKKLVLARIMSNIIFRTIKYGNFDFTYKINIDDTATCVIDYVSYTGSNPPIKIKQIFTTMTYKEGR